MDQSPWGVDVRTDTDRYGPLGASYFAWDTSQNSGVEPEPHRPRRVCVVSPGAVGVLCQKVTKWSGSRSGL